MEAHQKVNQTPQQPQTNVRIQLIDSGCALEKGTQQSSGWDLKSRVDIMIPNGLTCRIPVGIALGLPEFWEAQVRSRSSSRSKRMIVEWGTIDADYRGEIEVQVTADKGPVKIEKYQRIAQIVFVPVPPVILQYTTDVIGEGTERIGGFGSTGS